ncbi:MAG TPA: Ig-like domain-containing protein [Anaerolineales bacterium]|nr:Ig-like domain-containing protein [Anaerolineales bacterium]
MRLKKFSQIFWKLLSISAVIGVLFALKPSPHIQASNLRFPDLRTLPPRDLRFDRTDVDAESPVAMHNVLRFSNTVYNAGEGKMEMWGSINPVTKNGIAYQRVYDTDGTYMDYQVGIFYYHIPHDHYHFEDWGQYELWSKADYEDFLANGGSSAEYTHIGTKTTACVLDEEFITTLIETPFPGVYPWTGCMPNAENLMVEGLSVGWGDTYDYYRFEQWIDLGQGTLADGDYVLRSISDPLNKMYESAGKADPIKESVADNEAVTYFTISGGNIMDSNPPSGTVTINDVQLSTISPGVTVKVIGRDDVSGVAQVMLSNDGTNWATYNYTGVQSAPQSISWNLADPAYGGSSQIGQKTVYVRFKDNAGNFSGLETDTIILGAVAPTSDYSNAVISDNPVSYWRHAEPSGTAAFDNQGINHGSYVNSPALASTGLIASDPSNTAVSMDGVDDHVKVYAADNSSLNTGSAVTLEAWIKPTTIPATGTQATIVARAGSYALRLNGNKLQFVVVQSNWTEKIAEAPAGTIVAGQKYHVVGTFNGTTLKLYVNGVLKGSLNYSGTVTPQTWGLFIGLWDETALRPFAGTIDEVALYNQALSESRIITHYDVGNGINADAPDTQINSAPGLLMNTTGATFTFSSPLATATFECSLDEAAFTACTSPRNLTNLSNGSHTFRVRAKNPQGVVDQTPASYIWTIDTVAPTAISIVRQYSSPTNIDTLAFNVTFSEAVTGVDAADFVINGSTTATITNVTLTTTSLYKVTVSGGDLESFNGSVGLNFNAATINDLANNAFAGAEPATDEVYVMDNTAPNVSSITRVNANPTSASTVDFTVTFTESVTGVDASDFSLTTTGVTGASITNVTGTGSTRTVSVNTGSGNGTIRLDKVFNATIADLTGNAINGVPFTSGESYTVDKNHAPTNITLSNNSINENTATGSTIGTFSTTDADAGNTFTYSFCGGIDDASFQINTNQLRNAAVFNFETKNSYSICIRSTDNTNQGFNKTFTINVANVNEAPVITEGDSVNVNMSENASPAPFSLTLNATDPENGTLTWSISTAAGHGTASASGTGTSKSIGYTPNLNYVGPDTFVVRISDGSLTDTITVNVTIGAVTNPPTNISLSNSSVNENLGTGIVIGSFSTTDIDFGETFTYAFCGGTDDASFQINGSQLRTGASYNFETKNSYSICVRSTDSDSLFFDKTFTINIANVNEAPVITEGTATNVSMSKNGTPTPFSLTLNASDPENTSLTWSISSGAGHGTASASGTGTSKSIGYTPATNYIGIDSFIVQVSDGSLTDTITVNVTINNSNSAPTNISLSNALINENQAVGSVIGTFTTTDIDLGESFTYAFCGGTDDASFQISDNQLKSAASYNFEAKSSYNICISATDNQSASFNKSFTITIVNVNEDPVITEGASIAVSMSANGNPNPFSLTLSATDPENSALTWSISSAASHGSASATGSGSSKAIGYTPSLNYTGTDSFGVQVSDGTNTDTITVNVTINAVNSAPTNINLSNSSIAENQSAVSLVGILSTVDPDAGDTFSYSFCNGADDASFQINGNQLKSVASFDYEIKLNYSICIRSTDSGSLSTTKTFIISITDETDTASFADVSMNYWAWQYIESIYKAGITEGCSVSPLNFCPDSLVTRAQMAVFLLKGEHGASYMPPAVGGSTGFGDVDTSHWAAAWIKQLAAESITSGCGGGNYCPEAVVTRDQMAIFLLKTKHGASYTPPPASGIFGDVPADYWAAAWIEQLAAEGITSGCSNGNYCPNSSVTRAQMAVFLVKTFNLP